MSSSCLTIIFASEKIFRRQTHLIQLQTCTWSHSSYTGLQRMPNLSRFTVTITSFPGARHLPIPQDNPGHGNERLRGEAPPPPPPPPPCWCDLLTQVNFCEKELASFYIHPGHFPGKEGISGVQLSCYSSLVRSAFQSQRKRDWESAKPYWETQSVGIFCVFAILTIRPDSAAQPSPALQPHTPGTGSALWHSLHHQAPSPREPMCLKAEVTAVHLLAPPPWGKATKSTPLATSPCYVNGLSWGEKQAGIYKPPKESSLSSQPGTSTCSGPTWAHAAQIQGFVLVTL